MMISDAVSFKTLTTFKTGGDARYFCRVQSAGELLEALNWAKEKNLSLLILGGGSNTLAPDEGFSGLVIQLGIQGRVFEEMEGGKVRYKIGAGENWDEVVAEAVERGLYGIENLSAIPGSAGAAPVQNIGAYGAELKDVFEELRAINKETGEIKTFTKTECAFGYRDSIFKKEEGKHWVITHVSLILAKNGNVNLSYRDLKEYFATSSETPGLEAMREAVIAIRARKLPSLEHYGTAGSFFKNPIVSEEKMKELKLKFPEMRYFTSDGGEVKLALGWVLEHVCNAKELRHGEASVYEKQALVLVNNGKATSNDVKALAKELIDCVKTNTGITIVPEVVIL